MCVHATQMAPKLVAALVAVHTRHGCSSSIHTSTHSSTGSPLLFSLCCSCHSVAQVISLVGWQKLVNFFLFTCELLAAGQEATHCALRIHNDEQRSAVHMGQAFGHFSCSYPGLRIAKLIEDLQLTGTERVAFTAVI